MDLSGLYEKRNDKDEDAGKGIENPLYMAWAERCLDDKEGKETVEEPGSTESMRELVEYITKALVNHPEQVKVSEVQGEQISVIELTVAKEDMGKVIGKQGRTAVAIRTILSAASMKIRKRSVLEIIE